MSKLKIQCHGFKKALFSQTELVFLDKVFRVGYDGMLCVIVRIIISLIKYHDQRQDGKERLYGFDLQIVVHH